MCYSLVNMWQYVSKRVNAGDFVAIHIVSPMCWTENTVVTLVCLLLLFLHCAVLRKVLSHEFVDACYLSFVQYRGQCFYTSVLTRSFSPDMLYWEQCCQMTVLIYALSPMCCTDNSILTKLCWCMLSLLCVVPRTVLSQECVDGCGLFVELYREQLCHTSALVQAVSSLCSTENSGVSLLWWRMLSLSPRCCAENCVVSVIMQADTPMCCALESVVSKLC